MRIFSKRTPEFRYKISKGEHLQHSSARAKLYYRKPKVGIFFFSLNHNTNSSQISS